MQALSPIIYNERTTKHISVKFARASKQALTQTHRHTDTDTDTQTQTHTHTHTHTHLSLIHI